MSVLSVRESVVYQGGAGGACVDWEYFGALVGIQLRKGYLIIVFEPARYGCFYNFQLIDK